MRFDLHTRSRAPRRRGQRPAVLAAAVLLLTVVLGGALLAACSSGPSTPGVAGAGVTTTTAGTSSTSGSHGGNPLAFAHCMQTHGVPDYPDPGPTGQTIIKGGPTSGLNPTSPAFQNAQRECRKYQQHGHLSPAQQAQAQAQALKFSQCMRAHGVPDFPDPQMSSTGGGMHISIKAGSGSTPNLNPSSPTFQAAQKACQKDLPGKGKGLHTTHGPGATGSGSTSGAAATATGGTS